MKVEVGKAGSAHRLQGFPHLLEPGAEVIVQVYVQVKNVGGYSSKFVFQFVDFEITKDVNFTSGDQEINNLRKYIILCFSYIIFVIRIYEML